ncbi:hypothetical protein CEN50_23840 [Fischerella thermalis CCMEE 5268]|uniref:Uncharacterized protein n=1 Tax=Fischerella thermalis CCMEE 5268 TaxID=2019662 RepID=A0A2N6K9Z5_9CYAN|nr:hypothetical protein CEN50_23840 [Fischerella thermalis CCMEE 5268]
MTVTPNAKTQKNTGRNYQCDSADSSERLGSSETASSADGAEQNRADYDDCSRENLSESTQRDNSTVGKILTRLKYIEDEYSSYIREDRETLESRLAEAKRREDNFKQVIKELEQDISDLIVKTEKL